ncbi:hypothetical protein COU54_00665 [Candidatus Pacearchaeota archaeon CG10_big_fil_rev_8_21_14_0_10_31_24]|nr:MAG: hypothetical protein COU54_00665 [Candidatus Pacearchaeota archaeon CG10_big_fil_rev_8_21_14_0_10_31_24]
MKEHNKSIEWWSPDGGFFGSQYITGDDSLKGYIPDCFESLEERTLREVDGVINLLNLQEGESVMDVPCGYGRHSIELAKRGHPVLGLDLNEIHLSLARDNITKNLLKFPKNKNSSFPNIPLFIQGNMLSLKNEPTNSFDAIINMFYSFGFFDSDEENESVMDGFYKQLKFGGRLLIHTDVSPEMIQLGNYQLSERRQLKFGGQLQIEEFYDLASKKINGSWTIEDMNGNKNQLTPYSVRIYSAQEFTDMALRAGFSQVEIYGSFTREQFTSNSNELIVVAKK